MKRITSKENSYKKDSSFFKKTFDINNHKIKSTNKKPSFEEGFFHSAGTYIHPTSIISPNVKLDYNVKIGPFCIIIGDVYIKSETRLHSHVSIGMPAQDIDTKKLSGSIEIGKNCEIREFVTISSPKKQSTTKNSIQSKTSIGDNCYIMNYSHIAHDVFLENNVTLINNVNLAGHSYIEHDAMLMANTGVHQFCKVGAYSAIAPFSGIRQDIPPYCLFNGTPARFAGLNLINLKRKNFSRDDIDGIKTITKFFFQNKLPLNTIKEQIKNDKNLKQNKYIKEFIHFIKNSSRGISRKTINDK